MNQNIFKIIVLSFGIIMLLFSYSVSAKKNTNKTNIIIILADDLGYADVGFQGSDIGTPFIVNWTEAITKENNGQFVSEYGCLHDIMATCVDVANTTYPEEYNGDKIVPTFGKSLLLLFKREKSPVHTEPIFREHEGNKAVHLGRYKLVSKWTKQKEMRIV